MPVIALKTFMYWDLKLEVELAWILSHCSLAKFDELGHVIQMIKQISRKFEKLQHGFGRMKKMVILEKHTYLLTITNSSLDVYVGLSGTWCSSVLVGNAWQQTSVSIPITARCHIWIVFIIYLRNHSENIYPGAFEGVECCRLSTQLRRKI